MFVGLRLLTFADSTGFLSAGSPTPEKNGARGGGERDADSGLRAVSASQVNGQGGFVTRPYAETIVALRVPPLS